MDNHSVAQSRAILKDKFSNGHQLTAADFASLIDASLNEADDKLARKVLASTGDMLCVTAGNVGAVIGILQDLAQEEADWFIRLNPSTKALEFRRPGNANSVLSLGKNGKVGIGTDQPGAQLQVNGTIHATDLTLTGRADVQQLKVRGELQVDRLVVNGVPFVMSPAPAPTNGNTDNPTTDGSPATSDGATPVGPTLPSSETGSGNVNGGPTPTPNVTEVVSTQASSSQKVGVVPADGHWHAIAVSNRYFQAYEVMAIVRQQDNASILRAQVVNVNGDYSDHAIDAAVSYIGSTKAKLELQWFNNEEKEQIELQIRVPSQNLFQAQQKIQFQILDKLPAAWQMT